MTLAVTVQKIDEALAARFTGLLVDGNAVAVFIEEPDPDRYPERVYPSITLKLMSMIPAFELMECDYDEEEEVSFDAVTDPTHPMRTMRQGPEPYRLLYSVDTWNRPFARDARDLLMLAMVSRCRIRSALRVENVAGKFLDLFMLAEGSVVSNDEVGVDEVVYHKTRNLEVSAWLDLSLPETLHRATAAVQFNVRGFKQEVPEISPAPASPVGLDIRFVMTDDGVQVIET